jgi:RNAse (barnase) inhibitor barstar
MLPLDHVRSTEPPWVYLCVLPAGQTPDAMVAPLPGIDVKHIEGSRCATKGGLLSEFARALEFPPYFGRNWDAFEECLTDLSWMPAAGYLIVIANAEQVLRDNEEDYATFIESLQAVGQEWGGMRTVPFHVVMVISEHHQAERADWRVPRLTC